MASNFIVKALFIRQICTFKIFIAWSIAKFKWMWHMLSDSPLFLLDFDQTHVWFTLSCII